ncbi:amino acid adenylation domain-containing protein [Nocardioides carbamazepini]|uniref:amino acid adenylation domain-containing protein n=1 Tax=Nocardioides carbamazepini TaxID=2854259 RepID=UPI00214A6AEA|nr:amino acid adenylation domain-containing protein [Nocardioides carbamazepini]MCR1785000.1 amino acid adenylation domain-containing protein [Nocardioides carbamazepini]
MSGQSPETLVGLFDRTAARWPNRVAISAPDGDLTYRQLQVASARLAVELREAGVRSGDLVGLITDRTRRAVVGLLAILRAGAGYVPIDQGYPPHRVRFILDDSATTVLVGDPALLAAECVRVIAPTVDEEPDSHDSNTTAPLADHSAPEAVAYVIYTSGSTGTPKGCLVTHRNVVALLSSALPHLECDFTDVWSVFHSMSFDFSVWELWGAWATGARAALVAGEVATSPDAWLAYCVEQQVTVLSQVPSVFRFFVQAHGRSAVDLQVRYVVLGGESVHLPIVARWLRQHRPPGDLPSIVINMYGITETTVHATAKIIDEEALSASGSSPIGRPLAHLAIDLRNEHGARVGDGQPGEMWISGTGVSSGYLNRPGLTAERFVTETDEGGNEVRYYRSGDLAKMAEGELEYLGRIDDQVQIRGYRVELGEIEKHLATVPGVLAAAAIAKATRTGTSVLASVIVTESSGESVTVESIRRHLATRLPGYMIPDILHNVDELPLTPSGKLDRRELIASID